MTAVALKQLFFMREDAESVAVLGGALSPEEFTKSLKYTGPRRRPMMLLDARRGSVAGTGIQLTVGDTVLVLGDGPLDFAIPSLQSPL